MTVRGVPVTWLWNEERTLLEVHGQIGVSVYMRYYGLVIGHFLLGVTKAVYPS